MTCLCDGDRDGETRAIFEYFKQVNPTWSNQWCKSRAIIEWTKGYRLVGFPTRLVLVQKL